MNERRPLEKRQKADTQRMIMVLSEQSKPHLEYFVADRKKVAKKKKKKKLKCVQL